jgi:deoxyribodipyrimidine photolyase-related protein
MVANVAGMSQHADGGVLATKPYASRGACIDRMSDYCRGCRYGPKWRLGEDACPFTAGYWSFSGEWSFSGGAPAHPDPSVPWRPTRP